MKRFVEIDTPLDPDTLLFYKMRGKEELSRLSEYELDLLSTDSRINLDNVLGKSVTVKLELADDKTRTFSGHVTRIALVGKRGRYHVYRATVRPWLWFLTRTTNCRIFQEKSVPDILQEVFDKHPDIADVKFQLIESYSPWDYCVQYRETDFDFVSRLMEHEGMYYFFTHSEGRHTLVVADSSSAHTAPGAGEIPFIEPEELGRVEREHVSEWSMTHELQSGKYMLTDYDFEKPRVSLQVKSMFKREHALADYEIYDYPGDYLERRDGESYARTRIEEVQAKFERVQGHTNARALATGALFTLTSHPREDQNTEYLTVSAEYEVTSQDYEALEGTAADYHCRFSALNSHQPFRAERITPKPIVQGPQTAIIVGPAGETIHTDKFGRVKVQFHWDRYGKKDDKSSCWIRVSQNWGGKGWGGMFIPHVGQEVIVQFLEGDPDSPLITGRVYNADNMPPVALPGGKSQSIIRDHGGNEIIMEGAAGGQKMRLHSPTHETTMVLGNSVDITTQSDYKVKNDGKTSWQTLGEWQQNILGNYKIEGGGDILSLFLGAKHDTIVGSRSELTFINKNESTVGLLSEIVLGWKKEIDPVGHKKATAAEKELIASIDKKIGTEATVANYITSKIIKRVEVLTTMALEAKQLDEKVAVLNQKIDSCTQTFKKLTQTVNGMLKIQAATVKMHSDGYIKAEADGSLILKSGGQTKMNFAKLKMNGGPITMLNANLKVTE